MRQLLSVLIVMILVSLGTAAEACRKPVMPRGADRIVPTSRINQPLFNKVVLVEVNYYRCKNGIRPLRRNNSLVKAASGHSNWIARNQKLSHTSNVRGQRQAKDRILRTYGKFTHGSENIAMVQRYWIDNRKTYYPKNVQTCHFENANRQRIPPHTYETLAKWLVKLWYDSPNHRRNMLDGKVHYMGSAIQFDAKHRNCGVYFATQNFTD